MKLVVVLLVAGAGLTAAGLTLPQANQTDEEYVLPKGFIIGAGTSSYQVEGAWNESGKGVSVFDYYYHTRQPNGPNADVACDSYHKYKEDVAVAKALKMQMYRFSLSWSRILPDGDPKNVNKEGIEYYNNLISELLANEIEPFITLYHFDHPQVLEDTIGGWTNYSMIEKMEQFGRVAFDAFANRVKYWVTLNEPHMHCYVVYNVASVPPAKPSAGLGEYQCIYHELVAHSRLYHMFKNEYAAKARPGTVIGLTAETFFASPLDNKYENIAAAERYNLFELGIQFDPIIYGDYPEVVKKYVKAASLAEGRTESRLPNFTEEEKKLLKGSTDFLGINAYFGKTVHAGLDGRSRNPSPQRDMQVVLDSPLDFSGAFSTSTPQSFRSCLLWLRDRYNNMGVFITENGLATQNGEGVHDHNRAAYHSAYLREAVKAIRDDNCNILGVTIWSLLDGFEWGSKRMMGLVYIDYTTPDRTRVLKESSAFYIQLMTDRKVPYVAWNSSSARQPIAYLAVLFAAALTVSLNH